MAKDNSIAQDLADKLVTKNFDPVYTDEKGRDALPAEAVVFSFDYIAGSGKNYGTAVIVLGDENDFQLFFGDNLGKSMENPQDKEEWFQFLEELSDFAVQHRYTFSPKDITQLKHTMAGIAAIKEGLFEGYYGTRRVSYMGEATDARLVIKHKKALEENDRRHLYVESLFIETADGERFKLPFRKLSGGRAMLEHVRQGGKPYDIRGCHIAEMVNEMAVLARFNRASLGRVFEGQTQQLVESAQNYYQSLQESLKHMATRRGYTDYFESWTPADVGSEAALVEDIKTLFVEQSIDARIEAALPTLAKLQQQGQAMKEAEIFENWVNNMAEGTWALPDTPEQEAQLKELMSQELIIGPDGVNATEQLYDLVGDDQLFDLISAAADADPNANLWDNAEIVSRLGELGVDTSAITQRSAEETPEPEGVAESIGQDIDYNSLEVDGIHSWDSPDYSDAYFSYGEYTDGTPLPDDVLDQLSSNGELLHKHIQHKLYEADTVNSFAECGTVAGGMAPVQGALEESWEDNPVVSAITRRIVNQRIDLLQDYGPAAVTQAIEAVANYVGDFVSHNDEIGTSDVSGWVKQVEQSLKGELAEGIWGQAKQDPMNYNAAITGSYYESKDDALARLKSLALSK